MTKPSDIPEEVWKEALRYWREDGCSTGSASGYARAIMAAEKRGAEAQATLVRDLADCLEGMTKHYVEVRNDLYGFDAAEEIEVVAAQKLIAIAHPSP